MSESARRRRTGAGLLAFGVLASMLLANCGGGPTAASSPPHVLHGTFELQAGRCYSASSAPQGSFLVIVDSADSKTLSNPSGGCANKYYTPLSPGKDKGIESGVFQANPSPTFDSHGNSLADLVIRPVSVRGFALGMGTSPLDLQDSPNGAAAFAPPRAVVSGSHLTMDLRSLDITYGGMPGTTCASSHGYGCWELGSKAASGTYDPRTHQFVVQWFIGESFTPLGDSMVVRLEGTFEPAPSHAT